MLESYFAYFASKWNTHSWRPMQLRGAKTASHCCRRCCVLLLHAASAGLLHVTPWRCREAIAQLVEELKNSASTAGSTDESDAGAAAGLDERVLEMAGNMADESFCDKVTRCHCHSAAHAHSNAVDVTRAARRTVVFSLRC